MKLKTERIEKLNSLFEEESLRQELKHFFPDDLPESIHAWGNLSDVQRDFVEHLKTYKNQADLTQFYRNSDFNLLFLAWNCAMNEEREKAVTTVRLAQTKGYRTALDWGAGIGATAFALALANVKVLAGEVSLPNIEFMKQRRKRLGLNLNNLEIMDLVTDLPQDTYDLIVCTEVLEHVQDPHELIRVLDNHLNPGGAMMLSWSFVDMQTHLPEHFHLQTPHPDLVLKEGFGVFVHEGLGLEFGGYLWFNNMAWIKPHLPVEAEYIDELEDVA